MKLIDLLFLGILILTTSTIGCAYGKLPSTFDATLELDQEWKGIRAGTYPVEIHVGKKIGSELKIISGETTLLALPKNRIKHTQDMSQESLGASSTTTDHFIAQGLDNITIEGDVMSRYVADSVCKEIPSGRNCWSRDAWSVKLNFTISNGSVVIGHITGKQIVHW